ncbi:galactose mutarotase [Rhodovastum atsumiense]|uniref:Aldose 1-epimerase n=2 Tax=Rhodovastum atsumiense TaxID=504468 RepID=A0A5M6IYC4_9PROT|nr:galactose mutarotase [Rhodovastum atsumiense]
MAKPGSFGAALLLALVLSPTQSPAQGTYVELRREAFQKQVDGLQTDLFTIRNPAGMVVKITNYGAKIEQILVPDRDGRLGDVVAGYDSIDAVMAGQPSMGAFIGRVANRIAKGRFTLDGQQYQVTINNPPNSLHGGTKGSRLLVFEARQLAPNAVEMTHVFKDGEEGYPGTLPVRVVYAVTDDNQLVLSWQAVAADKKTIANFTGHTFFNLSGVPGSSILDHVVTLNADRVLDIDETLIPTGKLRDVAGSPMDFRQPKPLGRDIDQPYDLLKAGNGYDSTWVVNKPEGQLGFDARVLDPKSGRIMEVWSTEPSLQLFSGNNLEAKAPRDQGKGGVLYPFRSSFAMEPAHYPDSVNHPEFPSTVLNPGQWYVGQIVYKFSTSR